MAEGGQDATRLFFQINLSISSSPPATNLEGVTFSVYMDSRPSRRQHPARKRISAIRLSTDTTTSAQSYGFTLPEYTEAPPVYDPASDDGEHADTEDAADESSRQLSPPRSRRYRTRGQSRDDTIDPFLDALLERSVQALEVSSISGSPFSLSMLTSAYTRYPTRFSA